MVLQVWRLLLLVFGAAAVRTAWPCTFWCAAVVLVCWSSWFLGLVASYLVL